MKGRNMPLTRRQMLAACVAAVQGLAAQKQPPTDPPRLGVVIHSYGVRSAVSRQRRDKVPFSDPVVFLDHCRQLGAAGVQVAIGARDAEYSARLRQHVEAARMYLEGIVRLPQDSGDVARFTSEVRTAQGAGATVLRCAILNGRRYETFDTAGAFEQFAKQAYASLGLAEPVLARHGMRLAIENHKDWRADELVDLLRRVSSQHVGVCVDTGNSIALLEDPVQVVETYAPWAFTTHLKDMGVAEYEDGFLLAEVPFGTGFLDLKKLVRVLRAANPEVRLNIEMITRDPLKVPCLTPKYWATLDKVPARQLAEALARVRRHAAKLAPVSHLPRDQQFALEEANVRRCLAYALA
jgi:sugar phosphate isomerase/epimerase